MKITKKNIKKLESVSKSLKGQFTNNLAKNEKIILEVIDKSDRLKDFLLSFFSLEFDV